MGLAVVSVATLSAAEREARSARFAAALMVCGDTEGDDQAVRELIEQLAPSPVLLLTSADNLSRSLGMLELGFSDLTRLPVQPEYLVHRLRSALQSGGTARPAGGGSRADWLIGGSLVMDGIRERLKKLAETDLTVAIYGESGTGKELAARTIHAQSRRSMGPLVVANCAAMPESLFENELFGHERGSYTGAARTTGGLVEEAAGGTLVLDEIGELALPLQSKLLRFLQFGTYRRVGGTKEMRSDARVVAITNRFLPEAVAARTFRADLFYRIHLLHAVMPPLRERLDDVPMLAEFVAEQFCRRYERPRPGFTAAALHLLASHDWPGNVRELEGVIQTTLALHDGSDEITAEQVQIPQWDTSAIMHPDTIGLGTTPSAASDAPVQTPVRLRVAGGSQHTSADLDTQRHTLSEAKQHVMERFEVDYLERILTATGGNVAEAARRAGTDRKTLWRLLRKHDMDAVDFKRRARTSE